MWVGTVLLVLLANACILLRVDVKVVAPVAAFWLLIVHPVYLLFSTDFWNRASAVERLAYSTACSLLVLLLGGLAINTVLPWVGITRPLDVVPVLILVDVINVVLYLVRLVRPDVPSWRSGLASLQRQEVRLLVGGGFCIALVVLGANRLNNDAGSQVTVVGLGVIAVTLAFLLAWGDRIASGITGAAIYLVSTALLLMTSLRGWSVTGHDIQREYRVFQLTAAHGHWDMSAFNNTFNGCLSITILPTQFAALMHIDDPYVYKVFFQLVFAMCPVMVYAITRRYFSERVAILSAIYFIAFPTFFTDMPFLNRQEIALLFMAAGILAITDPIWSKTKRQVALILAAIGMELSHYSTAYVFVGTLVIAWIAGQVAQFLRWSRKSPIQRVNSRRRRWKDIGQIIGLGCVLLVAGVVFVWGSVATHILSGAAHEITSAISGVSGESKSSTVSYGLIAGKPVSAQTVLNQYWAQTMKSRSSAPPGTFLPAGVVSKYPLSVVKQPDLPVTAAGRILSAIGIPPSVLNTDLRLLAAKGEQLFLVIGILAILLSRRLSRRMAGEYFYLCIAGLVMLVVITIVPELSVQYGVLRVFQQELILTAPIIVIGSLTLFRPLGREWGQRAAMVVCLLILISTTGLLPQIIGGYPPQLNLNNSGVYYDLYYTHPENWRRRIGSTESPEPCRLAFRLTIRRIDSPSPSRPRSLVASSCSVTFRRYWGNRRGWSWAPRWSVTTEQLTR